MDLTEAEKKAQNGYGGEINVTFQDNVAIIRMDRGENRFNYDFVERFNKALDIAEHNPRCIAVVTTGSGKFYCNGMDLEWFKVLEKRDPKLPTKFDLIANNLMCRLITFPVPVIAAINGHAFAMGAVLATAHDHRIMREDRGWYCLNEVRIGILFMNTSFASVLIRRRLSPPVFHDALILGKRFTGPEAQQATIVHSTTSSDLLLPQALTVAQGLKGISRETLRGMKEQSYHDVLQSVDEQRKLLAHL